LCANEVENRRIRVIMRVRSVFIILVRVLLSGCIFFNYTFPSSAYVFQLHVYYISPETDGDEKNEHANSQTKTQYVLLNEMQTSRTRFYIRNETNPLRKTRACVCLKHYVRSHALVPPTCTAYNILLKTFCSRAFGSLHKSNLVRTSVSRTMTRCLAIVYVFHFFFFYINTLVRPNESHTVFALDPYANGVAAV